MFDIASLFSDPEMVAARERLAERWKAAGIHDGSTLPGAIADAAERDPDNTIIFHSAEHPGRITLRALAPRSEALARALQAHGLGPGDVVAVQMPNRVETLLLYAALSRLGCIFVPIVHIYGTRETDWILRASKARAYFCPDRWNTLDFGSRSSEMPATKGLDRFVVGDRVPDGAIPWSELVSHDPGDEPAALPRVSGDDPLLIVYTSGTTAEPKGVVHTHHSMLTELRNMPHLPMGRTDVVSLQPWPAGHIGGLCALLGPIVTGTHCILMDRWDVEEAAVLIEEHDVTTLCGTPFHVSAMLDRVAAGDRRLESVGEMISGGAGIPPELIERCGRAGWIGTRSYGSSEHPTASAGNAAMDLRARAYTDGMLCAHTEIRIVDDSGHDLPTGVAGEIWLRGPEQFVGYTDPTLNADAFVGEGWFRSGDVGILDASGTLTITDRIKDVIIRGGENLSSLEIEDLLLRHPAVSEAAAVGMPDERYGERVCAFIVPAEGSPVPSIEDLIAHFAQLGVARQKTPERVEGVSELPRTPAGKIKKELLRKRLGDSAKPSESTAT